MLKQRLNVNFQWTVEDLHTTQQAVEVKGKTNDDIFY